MAEQFIIFHIFVDYFCGSFTIDELLLEHATPNIPIMLKNVWKGEGIFDRPFSLMIRHRHVVDGLIWQRHAPKEVLVNGLTLRGAYLPRM